MARRNKRNCHKQHFSSGVPKIKVGETSSVPKKDVDEFKKSQNTVESNANKRLIMVI